VCAKDAAVFFMCTLLGRQVCVSMYVCMCMYMCVSTSIKGGGEVGGGAGWHSAA